jgi:hypothetical protein
VLGDNSTKDIDMNRKSTLFLAAACVAMIVALARSLGAPVGERAADFSTGLAAALMFGVLVTRRGRSSQH